jgi:hypothetical protein
MVLMLLAIVSYILSRFWECSRDAQSVSKESQRIYYNNSELLEF